MTFILWFLFRMSHLHVDIVGLTLILVFSAMITFKKYPSFKIKAYPIQAHSRCGSLYAVEIYL